jgi:hypothetical protein
MEGLVKKLEITEIQAITKRASLDMLGQQGQKVNMYAMLVL